MCVVCNGVSFCFVVGGKIYFFCSKCSKLVYEKLLAKKVEQKDEKTG